MSSTREAFVSQMTEEARAMASYALGAGRAVPGWALDVIARMTDAEEGGGEPGVELGELARAHAALATLIAPVRPDLVLMIEVESNVHRAKRFFGRVGIIRSFMFATLLSVVTFIALSLSPYIDDPRYGDIFTSNGLPLLINELFFLSSAAVGASFSGLFQADREITAGTFQPKQNSSYWVRFVLGLVAGLLLATVLHISSIAPPDATGITRFRFTSAALALVGGFSSSVVQLVIQRLIEAMMTILRGSVEQELELREKASRVRMDEALSRERTQVNAQLADLQRRLAAGESPESLRGVVDEMSRQLLSPDGSRPLPPPGAPPAQEPPAQGVAGPFEVRAVVEGDDGAPLAGALYEIHHGGEIVASGRTDARGELAHEVSAGGEHEVIVFREGAPLAPGPRPDAAPAGGDAAARAGRAAWHAMRRELSRGVSAHGEGATWETAGPNRGPVIDDYLRAFMSPASAAPWCGMLVGYCYLKAGFKQAGQIPASQTTDGRPVPRKTMFMSAIRLKLYLTGAGCPLVELPTKGRAGHPTTSAACAAWLDEHLRGFAPRPGDIVLFHTSGDYNHVGMVASYDAETHEIVTYEGNHGDRAGAFQWSLSDPAETGFYRVNMIARLRPDDFDGAGEVSPEGPSPEPKIERGVAASSR